ncbi:MAG: hypothetical protein AB8F34_15445 [Akkermansiaceae bacterium]
MFPVPSFKNHTSKKAIAVIVLGLLLTLNLVTLAKPSFTSPVSYQFLNGQQRVIINAGNIKNLSSENATGSMKLQLWATQAKYQGGTLRGHQIASTGRINGLNPNNLYRNYATTLTARPPKYGTYNLVLALLEYRSGNYVIIDSVNMPKRVTLGKKPKLFDMRGPWSWRASYEGGTVKMNVAKISHTRRGLTGTLKLSVWLTKSPYRGGSLRGYEIGQVRKGQLKAGFVFNNVRNTAKFKPPPAGTYYASLVLSESNGQNFSVVSYLTDRKPVRLGSR